MLDYRSVKDATKASLKMRVACLLARPSSKDPSRGIDNLARTKMAVVYMISMLVVVGSLRIKLVVGSEKEGRIKSLFPYPKHPGKHLLRFVFSKVCFGGPVTPNLSRCDWMSRVTGGLELFVGVSQEFSWFRGAWIQVGNGENRHTWCLAPSMGRLIPFTRTFCMMLLIQSGVKGDFLMQTQNTSE